MQISSISKLYSMSTEVFGFFISILIGFGFARFQEKDTVVCSELYEGGCHCGEVVFKVRAPKKLVVWKCNCSICNMKRNYHFIVPEMNFELLRGQEALNEYTFNTKRAKHLFCSKCGVQSFYRPRSNPDGVAITFSCLSNYKVSITIAIKIYTNFPKLYEDLFI